MKNNLKKELEISNLLIMYVGNLETYQGIDLLLESFALTLKHTDQSDLVIIGGEASDIKKYQNKAQALGIETKVHFLGPKPVEHLGFYLDQADILVSPRIKGKNTPMKLYSYLDSGKALIATDLPTHTQLLNQEIAMLAEPTADAYSEAMISLIKDANLRFVLGDAGKQLIEQRHTFRAFRQKLNSLYDWLQEDLLREKTSPSINFMEITRSN